MVSKVINNSNFSEYIYIYLKKKNKNKKIKKLINLK